MNYVCCVKMEYRALIALFLEDSWNIFRDDQHICELFMTWQKLLKA